MAKYFVTFIKKSPNSSNISGEEIFYESDKSLYGEEFDELVQELTTHCNVAETEYNLFHDMINYILVDEEEKDIYFGGKKLFLTDGEYKIVKFFAYNREKMFTIDEILDYLHLRKRVSENTFYVYISNINSKCYDQHREDIIIRTTYGYGISKVTGKFKP